MTRSRNNNQNQECPKGTLSSDNEPQNTKSKPTNSRTAMPKGPQLQRHKHQKQHSDQVKSPHTHKRKKKQQPISNRKRSARPKTISGAASSTAALNPKKLNCRATRNEETHRGAKRDRKRREIGGIGRTFTWLRSSNRFSGRRVLRRGGEDGERQRALGTRRRPQNYSPRLLPVRFSRG